VWDIIVLGNIVGLAYCVCFIMVFPYPSKQYVESVCRLVYTALVLDGLGILGVAGLVYYNSVLVNQALCGTSNGVKPQSCYSSPELGLKTLSYVICALFVLLFIYCIIRRRAISASTQLFTLISEPLQKVKHLLFVPFFILIIGLIIVVAIMALVLFTFSIGKVNKIQNNNVPGGYVNSLEFQSTDKLVLAFVLLMLLWWALFLIGITDFIIGGVIGCWYFSREKSVLYSPIRISIRNCFKYHLGSIARGSFYSLIFRPIGFFFRILYGCVGRFGDNCCCVIAAYCCCACFAFYHRYLKYSDSSGLIFQSLFGQPYAVSSKQCYFLMKRHSNRINKPLSASRFSVLLIRLNICIVSFITVYAFLTFSPKTFFKYPTNELSTTLAPSVFALAISIYCAQVSGHSLMSIITAYSICVIADEELFTGEQRFMKSEGKEEIELVATAKKTEDVNVEVQMPGRSNRMPVNFVEFDKSFNAKVTPLNRSRLDNSGILVQDLDNSRIKGTKYG
jgi:hypothetical protein